MKLDEEFTNWLNNMSKASLEETIGELTSEDKAQEIDDILNNYTNHGGIDAERANKAYQYLEIIESINIEDFMLSKGSRLETDEYGKSLKQLKETELRLSIYVLNQFFKDLYLNADKINKLPKEPTSLSRELQEFTEEYSWKIKRINELRGKLLRNKSVRVEYGVKPWEIATKQEIRFLEEMKNKLCNYLMRVGENVQRAFNLG